MIFDESTSALDPETERQLLADILSKKDKTIIFVTHRPCRGGILRPYSKDKQTDN